MTQGIVKIYDSATEELLTSTQEVDIDTVIFSKDNVSDLQPIIIGNNIYRVYSDNVSLVFDGDEQGITPLQVNNDSFIATNGIYYDITGNPKGSYSGNYLIPKAFSWDSNYQWTVSNNGIVDYHRNIIYPQYTNVTKAWSAYRREQVGWRIHNSWSLLFNNNGQVGHIYNHVGAEEDSRRTLVFSGDYTINKVLSFNVSRSDDSFYFLDDNGKVFSKSANNSNIYVISSVGDNWQNCGELYSSAYKTLWIKNDGTLWFGGISQNNLPTQISASTDWADVFGCAYSTYNFAYALNNQGDLYKVASDGNLVKVQSGVSKFAILRQGTATTPELYAITIKTGDKKKYDDLFFWDSLSSVIWQYDKSVALQTLLKGRQDFYDKSTAEFFTSYFDDVVNINTANSFGLTVWGQILQMPRPYYIDSQNNKVVFDDELYRLVLKAKLLKLRFPPTIPNINKFLGLLFPKQDYVYCVDNYNMTITYVFSSLPEEFTNVSIDLNDFFMRPAGVKIVSQVDTERFFALGTYDDDNESIYTTGFGTYEGEPMGEGKFADYEQGE